MAFFFSVSGPTWGFIWVCSWTCGWLQVSLRGPLPGLWIDTWFYNKSLGCSSRPMNYILNVQIRRESPCKPIKDNYIFLGCCKMGTNLMRKPRSTVILIDFCQYLLNLVLERKCYITVRILKGLTSWIQAQVSCKSLHLMFKDFPGSISNKN